MWTALAAAIYIASSPAVSEDGAASFEEFLNVLQLDELCFSSEQVSRDRCVEIAHRLTDLDYRRGHRFENDLRCHYGDLLSLRDVGMWGWIEIQEALAWSETPEGRRALSERNAQWSLEAAQGLSQSGIEGRERIRKRREGALPPILCWWIYW